MERRPDRAPDRPLIQLGGPADRVRRLGISRTADRRITAAGLALAGGFLVLAGLALVLPAPARHGAWLPLHLALAGGAGTAVAAAMPCVSGALSAGAPADPRLRVLSLAGIVAGALLVAGGFDSGHDPVAALGGLCYLVGMAALLAAILLPLRSGLGPRGWIVVVAYAVAVLDVLAGAALATSYVAGLPAVAARWGTLKPAHAWLNLLGFVSLIIVASLVHLLPTVLGTRIRSGPGAWLAVAGTAIGAPTVACGFVLQVDVLGRLGAVATVLGAVG